MTTKKIILFASILVAAVAVTIGVLVLLKLPKPTTTQSEVVIPARGYKPTDATIFRKIDGVTSLTSIETYPKTDGWVVKTTEADAKLGKVTTENANCSLKVTSFATQYIDTKQQDYGLSKAYTVTVASGEEGMLSDDYIITVPSTQGDADFYSAIYKPKVEFTGPTATTPTVNTKATMKTLDGDYTTFVAVRLIATPIGATTEVPSQKEGAVGVTKMIPAVVIKYRCLTSDFNVDAAIRIVKQLTLNFTSTTQTPPAGASSTGK